MAIQIEDYVAPVKVNPYIDDVTALRDAGEGKLGRVTVAEKDAPKHKLMISKAANEIGLTASHKFADTVKGKTTLAFTLVPKHAPRRGK